MEGAVGCSARVTQILCCCSAGSSDSGAVGDDGDEGCQARHCHVTAPLPTGSVLGLLCPSVPSLSLRGRVGVGSASLHGFVRIFTQMLLFPVSCQIITFGI